MNKVAKFFLLICIIIAPILIYNYMGKPIKKNTLPNSPHPVMKEEETVAFEKPQIALIFDDLGQSLRDIKNIYALKIPLSVAVIPELKFSKNISYIADKCGYSVLIHLPMEPKSNVQSFVKIKRNFIRSDLTEREIYLLLKRYLNSLKVAVGVNNHMGSKATEDRELMRVVLSAVRRKNLIFIDSYTAEKSCVAEVAKTLGVPCGVNSTFLDSVDEPEYIRKKIHECLERAFQQGKIIVIAHPKKNTLNILREELPILRKKVEFITIEKYFGL